LPPLPLPATLLCFCFSLLDTMATFTAFRTNYASLDGAPIEPSNYRAGGRRRGGREVRREANRTVTDTNQDSSDQDRADNRADGRTGTGTTQEEADLTRADEDGPYLDRADADPLRADEDLGRADEDHPRADEDLGRADGPVADARIGADVDRRADLRADRRAEDDLRMADARTQNQDRMLTARKRKADAEDEDGVPTAKRIKIEHVVSAGASMDEDVEDWYDEDECDEDEYADEDGGKDAFEDMVRLLGRGVTEEEASQRMRDAGNAEQAATWLDATALSELVSWALAADMGSQGAFTTETSSHDRELTEIFADVQSAAAKAEEMQVPGTDLPGMSEREDADLEETLEHLHVDDTYLQPMSEESTQPLTDGFHLHGADSTVPDNWDLKMDEYIARERILLEEAKLAAADSAIAVRELEHLISASHIPTVAADEAAQETDADQDELDAREEEEIRAENAARRASFKRIDRKANMLRLVECRKREFEHKRDLPRARARHIAREKTLDPACPYYSQAQEAAMYQKMRTEPRATREELDDYEFIQFERIRRALEKHGWPVNAREILREIRRDIAAIEAAEDQAALINDRRKHMLR
ncbi:hypothetical protein TRAPUB_9485, partial [Trametes pubescens]